MFKIRAIIDSRIKIPIADLKGEGGRLGDTFINDLANRLVDENPAFKSKKFMSVPTTGEPEFYVSHRQEWCLMGSRQIWCMSIPRGANHILRELAAKYGCAIAYEDRRFIGDKDPSIPLTKVRLHDYQEDLVASAIKTQNCCVRSGTGSGKTTAAIALVGKLQLPTIIIVWSANLFDQWVTRIEKELGIKKKDIGVIKGTKHSVKPITVAMQQTLMKCVDQYADKFGVVICDELQRFGSKTFNAVIDKFSSKYRIGFSADETRKDRKEFLIYHQFGPIAADIDREELIKRGFVLDVEIRVIPTEYSNAAYFENRDFDFLLKDMQDDKDRNQIALDVIKEEAGKGEQVFVLSHRREHCLAFDQAIAVAGVKTGILIGGPDYKSAFDDTKDGMLTGRIRVGVGTVQAIGQGLDIPSVGRAVVMTPIANNRQQFGQVRGRVCRTAMGKTTAILYYLWDKRIYGNRVLKNLQEWNNQVTVKVGNRWVPVAEYLAGNPSPVYERHSQVDDIFDML